MMMDEPKYVKSPRSTSWLSASLAYCCSPIYDCFNRDEPERGYEPEDTRRYQVTRAEIDQRSQRSVVVLRDQPGRVPPPLVEVPREAQWPGSVREKTSRKSFSSSRSFSVRKRFLSNASTSRRPQISAPSNFRHVQSESFRFPSNYHPRARPSSFRPLELSIYLPDNQLSPMLPHFEFGDFSVLAQPPAAVTYPSRDDDSFALNHERSYSSLSFHLPRRPLTGSPPQARDVDLPRPPPKARTRAYTSPSVEGLLERIASTIIEKERIQSQIDDVVERQSIYISSRPSTAYGLQDLEPLPSMPAMPPAAPSFAERLNSAVAASAAAGAFERPSTAPPSRPPVHIPMRAKTFNEAASTFHSASPTYPPPPPVPQSSSSPTFRTPGDRTPPPPLPLVLRPPLRKKKSFSRVSSWLLLGDQLHSRDVSRDSITNLPRPVRGNEGFYQCVGGPSAESPKDYAPNAAPPAAGSGQALGAAVGFGPAQGQGQGRMGRHRPSVDTVSTLSSWTSEEDELQTQTQTEEHTLPTTWSPGSSPATKTQHDSPLERVPPTPPKDDMRLEATVGAGVIGHKRTSVGVAF